MKCLECENLNHHLRISVCVQKAYQGNQFIQKRLNKKV